MRGRGNTGKTSGPRKHERTLGSSTEPLWYALFLKALAVDGIITNACKAANIARSTYYDAMERDPAFKALAEAAVEESVDELLHVARLEAVGKNLEGKPNGRAPDRDLLKFLIKAKRHEYRDSSKVELSGTMNVKNVRELTDDELAAIAAAGIGTGSPGAAESTPSAE